MFITKNQVIIIVSCIIIVHYYTSVRLLLDMSTAVLYGTALECLYIGADVIIDVIENINKCINELQVWYGSVRVCIIMIVTYKYMYMYMYSYNHNYTQV